MTEVALRGCRTAPLGSYLASLGLLRVVTRLVDPSATGRWQRQMFVLGSTASSVSGVADMVVERFEPETIVSPWNSGSGFAGNGRNPTAEATLAWVRESAAPRLARLRGAVAAADGVVAAGRARGWGGTGRDMWDKAAKSRVLALCRARFPDDALAWLDAAVALGDEDNTAFSRLLGTGGNFGRQDLCATYLARVRTVLSDKRSRDWLAALLTGDETVPYLREPVGQFDPGRAGGIQSSPFEKRDDSGFANPWAFLLAMEGTLLFASAMVRRHGAGYAHAALPFQVRGSTGAHDTAASGETALGELWAPEWAVASRLDEVAHLLGEGRAEWRERPAHTGLDFVRAIAGLGVDRGIEAFQRHVFVDRLGQNPLAVPADRVTVELRGEVRLLAELDRWLESVSRGEMPTQVAARVRQLERALYVHARSGHAADLVGVFAALGRAHEAASRSGTIRRTTPPLVLGAGRALMDALRPHAEQDQVLRLALALATARDDNPHRTAPTLGGLRPLLSPVDAAPGGRPRWTPGPALCPLSGGLVTALAEAARRRTFPDTVYDPTGDEQPAVRGVPIAFNRGQLLRPADIAALLYDPRGDHEVADLLAGLLTIDWRGTADGILRPASAASDLPSASGHDTALDLLLPFAARGRIRVAARAEPVSLLLRPGSEWPAKLAAGQVDTVLADAARRLRISGLRFVITPHTRAPDGRRLTAILLLRAGPRDIVAALRRVAVLPEIPKTEETTVA